MYKPASELDLTLLLHALGSDDTVFVLGAGTSAPEIPTIGQLPDRLAPFASELSSFAAGPVPDSALRQLIAPLIERGKTATTFEEYLPAAISAGTVAVLIEDMIARAHHKLLPQYELFRLCSTNASVISFNWDGLANARCPQRVVLHPHGALAPRPLVPDSLSLALDYSQEDDYGLSREWLLPGLVMPGEEERPEHAETRERVFQIWLTAGGVVIVGYTFGLGSTLAYDRVWLDTFVVAMKDNPKAAIHIVSPDAESLRAHLCDLLGRGVNIHDWAFRWNVLAGAILHQARVDGAHSVVQLFHRGTSIAQLYLHALRRLQSA